MTMTAEQAVFENSEDLAANSAKPRPVREAWFLRAGFLSIG
jgi:hypothetical protein